MTHAISPMAFAAPVRRLSALPRRIALPAGTVTAQTGFFLHAKSVLGMYLSGEVSLIRIPRWRSQDHAMLIEQLVGWLCARGFSVVRVRVFWPLVWTSPRRRAPLRTDDCIIHAARIHLARLSSECPRDLPITVLMPAAVRDVVRVAYQFWADTAKLLYGLEKTDANLMLAIAPTLIDVAKSWEFRVARLLLRAQKEGWIKRNDMNLVASCDRAWKTCVNYVPAYEVLAETTSRLL
jgi:hypothetical protein